jgi:hypothetical protein
MYSVINYTMEQNFRDVNKLYLPQDTFSTRFETPLKRNNKNREVVYLLMSVLKGRQSLDRKTDEIMLWVVDCLRSDKGKTHSSLLQADNSCISGRLPRGDTRHDH